MLVDFLLKLQTKLEIGYANSLNYPKSIGDMIEFRKSHGVSDDVNSFKVTKVYLRRGKRCLANAGFYNGRAFLMWKRFSPKSARLQLKKLRV